MVTLMDLVQEYEWSDLTIDLGILGVIIFTDVPLMFLRKVLWS